MPSCGNTDFVEEGEVNRLRNTSDANKAGSSPYGTGPGFRAKGGGPVFGPNNMGEGSDLPVALSMLLMENPLAMQRFNAMSKEEKAKLLKYVESGVDGMDAQSRIEQTVKSLQDGVPGFYTRKN
jgi:hypothetical protein